MLEFPCRICAWRKILRLPCLSGISNKVYREAMIKAKTILLDVDYTLYPRGTGPFREVSRRIEKYVVSTLSLGLKEARELRMSYISRYGSTLGGLMHEHGVDPDEFLRYVHDVPVEDLLSPDEKLRNILENLPYNLVIFSNASRDYVERVLRHLGVADLMGVMFTIESMDFIPKPRKYPYHKVMDILDARPEDLIIVDDMVANVSTALKMGMAGILVGASAMPSGAFSIHDIYDIVSVIP